MNAKAKTPAVPRTAYSVRETVGMVVGMSCIFVLNVVACLQLDLGTTFGPTLDHVLNWFLALGAVVFGAVVVASVFFGARRDHPSLLRAFVVYLGFATVQVVANVAALLGTAKFRHDSYLWGLWDIGAAYLMVVAIFTGWYWVLDLLIPGGAFEFPVPEGREPERPRLIDYMFIAFNTNSTFGPTAEAVLSRRVKVLMMFQTICSLFILLVMVARIVGMSGG